MKKFLGKIGPIVVAAAGGYAASYGVPPGTVEGLVKKLFGG